ncbi:MAG: CDP-alcohol phosphatidyltransferase family protein [Hyphomonadaceae bacterium]
MIKQLPNALTLLRLVLAPLVAAAVWQAFASPADAVSAQQTFAPLTATAQGWALAAAIMFVLAALTDLFDGMAARALDAHSKFGRIIDPIADKALVGLPLIVLSAVALMQSWPLAIAIVLSSAVIVGRDVFITWLRFASPDGEGVRVSQLAKWKTALELIAVAIPLLIAAAPSVIAMSGAGGGFVASDTLTLAWIAILAAAAALSAYTAAQYLMARS